MSRWSFRGGDEEHNFYQNYTDLMSGFLIVFIIASLVAYGRYKVYVDLYKKHGITEANITDIVVNADMYEKIRAFEEAQKTIKRRYFTYNEKYQRFECTVDVMFQPDDPELPPASLTELREAGREIEAIIDTFNTSVNVSFKVVVEGRAAKSHKDPHPSAAAQTYAARLSYERANNLYRYWRSQNLLGNIEKNRGEIFISGAGFGGSGRYSGYGPEGEDKNKTFIIQIIPFITASTKSHED